MNTPKFATKTSQLYFNGGNADADEVVVMCFLKTEVVLKRFQLEVSLASKVGKVIQDYGFCQLRAGTAGCAEFVTTTRGLARTIKGMRAWLKASPALRRDHKADPVFKIDIRGSQELMRKIRIERIADACGCVYSAKVRGYTVP